MEKAKGEALMSAVMPKAERPRNKLACVRIARTPQSERSKPWVIPLLIQLTALGPGVVTKTSQKSANMVQASKLMGSP